MEENARSGTTGEEARAVGENFGDVGLSLTKNGTVKQTISNCVVALRTDEKTQDMFRYNMLTDKIQKYCEEYLSAVTVPHVGVRGFHYTWTSEVEREAIKGYEKSRGIL